jgi:hypothetical protein
MSIETKNEEGVKYPKLLQDFVRERGEGVTFVEITRFLKQFFETEGDGAVFVPSHPNTVFWAGMSPQYVDVIKEAVNQKLIIPKPTSLLVYLIDGGALKLPTAKGSRKYKKPHWLPIAFNLPK